MNTKCCVTKHIVALRTWQFSAIFKVIFEVRIYKKKLSKKNSFRTRSVSSSIYFIKTCHLRPNSPLAGRTKVLLRRKSCQANHGNLYSNEVNKVFTYSHSSQCAELRNIVQGCLGFIVITKKTANTTCIEMLVECGIVWYMVRSITVKQLTAAT